MSNTNKQLRTRVGKTYRFSSAHYLPEHPHCGQVHGHTYTLEVVFEGPIQRNTNDPELEGMILDFHMLNIAMEDILRPLDHRFLNVAHEVPNPPTVELMAEMLFQRIDDYFKDHPAYVHGVRLQEGGGGYALITRS